MVAKDAGLPEGCRVHPDHVVPETLPVWGSITDDIWALDHTEHEQPATVGPQRLADAEDAWVVRGVAPNVKKSIDGAHGEEIQGYFVHPTKRWVLVYPMRRNATFSRLPFKC